MEDQMLNKIKNMNNDKRMYVIMFLVSFLSLFSAFMLEWFAGFKPCFLCWTQRFGFALVMLLSLAFMLKTPTRTVTKVSSYVLTLLASLFGVGVALRHMYIIKNPESATCGFGPDMVFDMMPFMDALMQFFIGSSSCTKVEGILGVPFPVWALMLFSLIAVICITGAIKSMPKKAKEE
jgi:disulfide bond formation protein DsbB